MLKFVGQRWFSRTWEIAIVEKKEKRKKKKLNIKQIWGEPFPCCFTLFHYFFSVMSIHFIIKSNALSKYEDFFFLHL